jgi:hypothetical protein
VRRGASGGGLIPPAGSAPAPVYEEQYYEQIDVYGDR